MKKSILISNDDGIHSPFLRILAETLSRDFDTFVAAPLQEQSGVGRSFSIKRSVHVHPQTDWHCPAWAIDGTPSDCVNIALGHLLPKRPDAIVSGINKGHNATFNAILCSGTVGAALEGAFWSVPSFALSIVLPRAEHHLFKVHGPISDEFLKTLGCACEHARRLIHTVIDQDHPTLAVHNINFPYNATLDTPVHSTEPTLWGIETLFRPIREGEYEFVPIHDTQERFHHPSTDFGCLQAGNISHTVLDYSILGALFSKKEQLQ